MIETCDMQYKETIEILDSDQLPHKVRNANHVPVPERKRWMRQAVRFGLVGVLNTIVDLLILNMLLLLFPTNSTRMILIFGAIAYSVGAVNSFLLNKYWTFGSRQRTTWREVVRFMVTTLCGICWSSIILWLAGNALHPILINPTVWANVSKVVAICGTVLINYLGMSLWVFVNKTRKAHGEIKVPVMVGQEAEGNKLALYETPDSLFEDRRMQFSRGNEQQCVFGNEGEYVNNHSLTVVLPAYNEEEIITRTVTTVDDVLSAWHMEFEIVIVNDGSVDRTGEIVTALASENPRIRVVSHALNEGYGATLASGSAAATKELLFFMDSDGQFDVRDLQEFLPLIDTYDAVIGYRIDRQDSWMRKLNAWGWKHLIGRALDVHVRDIDCAFKLLHTRFLQEHPLETRGAMINAELLYRLKRAGGRYQEVGVIHLPRLHGQATGAKLSVILRAFRELFKCAYRWHREEKRLSAQQVKQLPARS